MSDIPFFSREEKNGIFGKGSWMHGEPGPVYRVFTVSFYLFSNALVATEGYWSCSDML